MPGKFREHPDVTVLIHGFNVNERSAVSAYQTFMTSLDDKERRSVFWVFWPGDVTNDVVRSTLGYPFTPARAVDCASRFADFLAAELGKAPELQNKTLRLVAHSMGCRLALELVKRLRQNARLTVASLAMMAPAVQRYRVLPLAHPDDDLRTGLGTVPDAVVYHSKKDRVLQLAFRSGQLFERSWFGTAGGWRNRGALGRHGLGAGNHIKPPGSTQAQTRDFITKHGHSDYWGSASVSGDIKKAWEKHPRAVEGRVALSRAGVTPREVLL